MSDVGVRAVSDYIAACPPAVRDRLETLRDLILQVAALDARIGVLDESLKWGEPAWRPRRNGVGTTVRLGYKPAQCTVLRVLFHCRTPLVDAFRSRFPELDYEGNRAIVLSVDQPLPCDALEACVAMALTWHLNKRERSG